MKRLLGLLLAVAVLVAVPVAAQGVTNEHDLACRNMLHRSDVYGFGIDATPTWAGEHWRYESPIVRIRVYYNGAGTTIRWTSSRPVLGVFLLTDADVAGGLYPAGSIEQFEGLPIGPEALGLWCYTT